MTAFVDDDTLTGLPVHHSGGLHSAVVVGMSGDPGTAIVLGAGSPLIDRTIDAAYDWVAGRRAGVLNEAAAVAGRPVEEVAERLIASPPRLVLLNTGLEAVTSSAWDGRIKVMGRALASGALAEDDAIVDEETYWARIISQLEAPHLRIIHHLIGEDSERPGHRVYARREELADISGFRGLIGHTLVTLEQNSLVERTTEPDELAGGQTYAGMDAPPVWVSGELAGPCHQRFLDAGVKAD